jgi:hypothetical protein
VIVAVIPMGMMQMAVDQIVDVVAVRDSLVPTSGTMHVRPVMPAAPVPVCTAVGIGSRYLDGVLVDVIAVHMVQMAVVQVVDVIAVADGRVPTGLAVLVRVIRVLDASAHRETSRFAGAPALSGIRLPLGSPAYAIRAHAFQPAPELRGRQVPAWCRSR